MFKKTIVYILDDVLDVVGVIDDYYSMIWTERYFESGDFEMELPIDYETRSFIAEQNFVVNPESEYIMMIESIKPNDDGDVRTLLISGDSAEGLLKRRSTVSVVDLFYTDVENYLYDLVRDHLILSGTARDISILTATINSLYSIYFTNQIDIDTVYNIVSDTCKAHDLGFKIVRYDVDPSKLEFLIYRGVDRSTSQSANPYVIFSYDFGNLLSGSYYIDHRNKVNVIRVKAEIRNPGSDPSIYHRFVFTDFPEPFGINRFESVLETTIDREVAPGFPLSSGEIDEIMVARGEEELKKRSIKDIFDGEFDPYGEFEYGVDFWLGDIVQVFFQEKSLRCRVVEMVRSYSEDEKTAYVSLALIN